MRICQLRESFAPDNGFGFRRLGWSSTDKVTRYFSRVALSVRPAMRIHRKEGFWESVDPKPRKSRRWEQVSTHCLVVAARVRILARLLGLNEATTRSLTIAAAAHDSNKPIEISMIECQPDDHHVFVEASQQHQAQLRRYGLAEDCIKMMSGIGHLGRHEFSKALDEFDEYFGDIRRHEDDGHPIPDKMNELSLATLILAYVDSYSILDWWVDLPRWTEGQPTRDANPVDARTDRNIIHPYYRFLNERRLMGGLDPVYEVIRQNSHAFETKIAHVLERLHGFELQPRQLPQFIDDIIRYEISQIG